MNTKQQNAPWEKLRGLFHPGNGVMPPYLAGRDEEQAVLNDFLFSLQNDSPADKDIVVYGPRGNGKTVFVTCFEETAMETLGEDSVLSLRPDDIDSREKLVLHLIEQDRSLWEALKERLPSKMALSGKFLETEGRLEFEWNKLTQKEQAHKVELLLADGLIKRCRKKPLVVTIDEAHTMETSVGKYLLNLSEKVRKKGAPFLLVLAGTPDLEHRINRMSSTFWSRARIFGFGRLTKQATTDALVIPLIENGFDFVPGALQYVIDDSQQYPYFIQLWGECLCNAMRIQKSMVVDMNLIEATFKNYDNQRTAYYRTRYAEISDEALMDEAVKVAHAFTGQATLSDTDLATVVDLDTKKRLRSMGYIWQEPLSIRYEPGIPSLMDYILTQDSILDGKRKHTDDPFTVLSEPDTFRKP